MVEAPQRRLVVQAQVVFDTRADWSGALAAARVWFETGWREFGGEICAALEAQAAGHLDPTGPLGPLGASFLMGVAGRQGDDEVVVDYGERGMREFLLALGNSSHAYLYGSQLVALGERRGPVRGNYDETPYVLKLDAYRGDDREGRFLVLTLTGPGVFLLTTPTRQGAVLGFVRAVAELGVPVFGVVGPSSRSHHWTGLERDLWTRPSETVARSLEVLRGYSWVTVVPDVLVERLGGVGKIAESGAFVRVEALRSGGVWLQATERFEDYQLPQAARVFAVLRPVLLEGAFASTFVERRKIVP